jgi:hypothetical protein
MNERVVRFTLALLVMFAGDAVVGQQLTGEPREQVRQAIGLIQQGKLAEAELRLRQVVDAHPQAPMAWLQLGVAYHGQQKQDLALEAWQQAARFPATAATATFNLACLHAIRGEKEKAFEFLAAASEHGFRDRGPFLSDRDLDSLRDDPRFAALVPELLEGEKLFVEPARILLSLHGEHPGDEFGWVARRVGDLDGDTVQDFVTTAPGFQNHSGKIYAYSTGTGKLLFSRVGETGQRFGNGAAGAGDVNGDGTPDVIIGGPASGAGRAEILSGRDGSTLKSFRGAKSGDQFGYKVSTIGDVDRDGHSDVTITALAGGGTGECFGYSGKTGKLLFSLRGEREGDKFGSAVCGLDDPRHRFLAVGAQDAGPGRRGAVYMYRIDDGNPSLVFKFASDETGMDLGQMFLSFPGDLNRDGIPDLYCSDFSSSQKAPGGGRVYVLSGADGSVLLDVAGSKPGEGLGTSPSDAGDINGDGVGDLAVGAWQNGDGAISGGKVYLFSGRDGISLGEWTCRQHGDTFGFDSIGIGDVDRDGAVDFLVTSAWSPVQGPKTGRVFVIARAGKVDAAR